MGDSLIKIRNQFNEYFQSLNNKQKIKIGLGSFFLVLTLALSIMYFTRPNYVSIYNGLSLEEAGEITGKLDELNIPWISEMGGTTILVPEDYLNKARMNLAIEGFPNNGITWEDALNNNSITMTSEERRMKFLRAQMNELSSTIEEINGITSAQVNLTVPEKSEFITEQNSLAKASVLLDLKPGFKLNPQQVNGIVMLVSNSVDGLNPENITIHDESGAILNDPNNTTEDYTVNNLDMEQKIKNGIQESIKKLLSKIYGESNVDVVVDVDVDFDKEVTEITEYAPPIDGETTGLIRSLNELKEQVLNGESGGPPGTDSNSNITEYTELDNSDSQYLNENRSVNYELNEIRKNIVKAPGKIENITVAIILNKKNIVGGELTEDHKQELINLVSAAAGLETKVVEVMAQDFNDDSEQIVAVSTDEGFNLSANLPLVSIGVVSLLLIVGALFYVFRIRRRKTEINEIMQVDLNDEDEVEEIDVDFNDKSSYRQQIERFIDKKPEAVAQLLRTWLNED